MSVLKKNQLNKILKKFKNRRSLKKKDFLKLKFGNIGFFFNKDCRFEFVYLTLLKKFLKNLNFLKFKARKFSKTWIFLTKNYPISTKSKNARMGKGKGTMLRWSSRIPRFFFFLEFADMDILKIQKFKKKLNKKFNNSLRIKFNTIKAYPLWIKKNNSYFFIKKYNLIT